MIERRIRLQPVIGDYSSRYRIADTDIPFPVCFFGLFNGESLMDGKGSLTGVGFTLFDRFL